MTAAAVEEESSSPRRQSASSTSTGGPLRPGDPIGTEIQVLKVLGEGGFGIVYLARSDRVGFCAVKTLRDELAHNERVVDLFEKEARIWIELERHPYIVKAHYVEEVGGRYYVVMEYVPPNDRGFNDLEGYLRRQRPELGQALWWAVEFCHGMEYAHSKGVRCHRDIKPANILIGPDHRIRITDFGIAGVIVAKSEGESPEVSSARVGATQAGTVFGTPTHMPPEQFLDAASCDERSDVYAFGVVLFQMVTGKLPFHPPPVPPGPDRSLKIWTALAKLHREQPVPQLSSPLFPIISKCMQKDRSQRYSSFSALRADLESLLKDTTGEVVAVPKPETVKAMDLANKGMSFATLDQYTEAVRCYDEALATDPGSAIIYNNKGNSLNRLGRREEAIACFDRAIELDPRYAAPHLNKGISLVWLQRYDEAVQCLDRAISLDPTMADAWTTKGVVLNRLGRRQEAKACNDKALECEPRNPVAWFNRAGSFHAQGQRAEALEAVERALESDPRYVVAWVSKGVLLGELGRHDEALQAFDRALVLEPRSGKTWYNKGNEFTSLENYEEGLRCFQKATELEPGFPVGWYNKAMAEIQLQRYDDAQVSFRQFLNVAPPHDEFRPNAQSLLQRLQGGERIVLGPLKRGDTVLSQDKESNDGIKVPIPGRPSQSEGEDQDALARLHARLKAGNLKANEVFDLLVRLGERSPDAEALAKNLPGVEGQRKGQPGGPTPPSTPKPAAPTPPRGSEPAAPSAEEVGDLRTQDCLKRATICSNQGQYEKALAWYEAALGKEPDNTVGMMGKGLALHRLRRFEEAAGVYGRVAELNPKEAKAWLGQGEALHCLGRHEDAATSYERVLAMYPVNPNALNGRGTCLLALGRLDEALECFDRALAKDTRFALARFNKAVTEDKLGRGPEAARSFQQFLSLAPPDFATQIQAARARLAELRAR